MHIAQNLKFLRKKKGKSQEEMAQALGLNRSTYSGYENEVAQPSLELLLQLAQSEKLPLEVLLSQPLDKLPAAEILFYPKTANTALSPSLATPCRLWCTALMSWVSLCKIGCACLPIRLVWS
jgi:transcriptional regulator with XRE-family HTH domain